MSFIVNIKNSQYVSNFTIDKSIFNEQNNVIIKVHFENNFDISSRYKYGRDIVDEVIAQVCKYISDRVGEKVYCCSKGCTTEDFQGGYEELHNGFNIWIQVAF